MKSLLASYQFADIVKLLRSSKLSKSTNLSKLSKLSSNQYKYVLYYYYYYYITNLGTQVFISIKSEIMDGF